MSRPTDRLPYTPPGDQQTAGSAPPGRPRLWPAIAAVIALGLALAFVWSNPKDAEQQREQRATERKAAAADRKSYMTSKISVGEVKANLRANWLWRKGEVGIWITPEMGSPSKYVEIDAGGQADSQESQFDMTWPGPALVTLPIENPPQEITVRVAVGDEDWKKGDTAPTRLLRLSPEGTLTDVDTGKELPTRFS
ncbi:hypothetical protein ACFV6B_40995 [Streptomyces microflavus]|uniref:hypothetical protein n=1 Tax=Streptomyces microflavus TaxID=1919 RepID=UPI00365C9ED8